jgi:hypothetical protein
MGAAVMIGDAGYDVIEADNADEAIAILEGGPTLDRKSRTWFASHWARRTCSRAGDQPASRTRVRYVAERQTLGENANKNATSDEFKLPPKMHNAA